MSTCPTFNEFYEAVTGRRPLPWQSALADLVARKGWPEEIGVPTGLGKTACIEIAIWSIAKEALATPHERRLPTRIWYVVNRRLLVNEAYVRAQQLSKWFQLSLQGEGESELLSGLQRIFPQGHTCREVAGPDQALHMVRSVAGLLKSRCAVDHLNGPLFVSELRGGLSRLELPPDPSYPSVVCSTAPMFGSRLLFRGYGGGRLVRPVETALTSCDSLVLLDEAHLSLPLLTVARQLAEADVGEVGVLNSERANPRFVSVTATGQSNDAFQLTDHDFANPIVAQRVKARRPTHLRHVKPKDLENKIAVELVEELKHRTSPAAAVVFLNSPKRAMTTFDEIRKVCERGSINLEVMVLTGQIRPWESAAIVDKLLRVLRSGRNRSELKQHLVVVATQTLEVGADLDFDVLMTQTASASALIQRFGRLNRTGDPSCAPVAFVFHEVDAKSDPIYHEQPSRVWDSLVEAKGSSGVVDLGSGAIAEILGGFDEIAPRSPELLPNHLDEWMKTSSVIIGEAPVELFLNGISDRVDRRCSVIWRANSAVRDPYVDTTVDLLPRPNSGETIELSVSEVQRFAALRGIEKLMVLSDDGVSLSQRDPGRLRTGDLVVLDAANGGYRQEHEVIGWDPSSRDEVRDLSIHRVPDSGTRPAGGILLDAVAVENLLFDVEMEEPQRREILSAVSDLCRSSASEDETVRVGPSDVIEFIKQYLVPLSTVIGEREIEERQLQWTGRSWFLKAERSRTTAWAGPDSDLLDELSSSAKSVYLADHLVAVGEIARLIGEQVGLPSTLVRAVENAGRLHDLGKIDPRFQRWLDPLSVSDHPVAKSGQDRSRWERLRAESGWPSGARHEALSVRILTDPAIRSACERQGLLEPDAELVLHLVAAHHGRGRPGLFGAGESGSAAFAFDAKHFGIETQFDDMPEIDGDLSRTDWEQPHRFRTLNQRYGRRGLALLEAVVRQADWVASARSEASSGKESE